MAAGPSSPQLALLDLPPELLALIVAHLDVRSFLAAEATCSALRASCDNKDFWRGRIALDFSASVDDAGLPAAAERLGVPLDGGDVQTWKSLYRSLHALRAAVGAITVRPGNIQDQAADALIVPTNTSMRPVMGSSMWSVIQRGGPALEAERRSLAPIPEFGCRVARAGDLRADHVIFTAGPFWAAASVRELKELCVTYDSCLAEVRRLSPRSVACAAISTGMRGYPIDIACRIAVCRVFLFLRGQLARGEPVPQEFRMICNPRSVEEGGTGNIAANAYHAALRLLMDGFGRHALSADPMEEGPSALRSFVHKRWIQAGPAVPRPSEGGGGGGGGGGGAGGWTWAQGGQEVRLDEDEDEEGGEEAPDEDLA
eukprot:tig00000057_g98.t1